MDQNKEKAWLFIRRDLQQLLRLTMQKLVSFIQNFSLNISHFPIEYLHSVRTKEKPGDTK